MDVDSSATLPRPQNLARGADTALKQQKTPTGKVLKNQNNKRTLWKNAFDSPFAVVWNPIAEEQRQQVVGALSSVLKDMPTRPTKQAPVVKVSDAQKKKFAELVVGLNSVTRALEKDELRLVVSTRDFAPARAIQHLPVLCAMRQIPLCPLPMTSQALAELMGSSDLRTVICFGFKRVQGDSDWNDVVSLVSSKSPAIDVPWIPSQGSTSQLTPSSIPMPTQGGLKAKRLHSLVKLKVRKIQHTAPVKPAKHSTKQPNTPTGIQSASGAK